MIRVLVLVAAAGLALTACQTKLAASPTVATPISTTASTSASTATSARKFPNTQPYVRLVGYDDAHKMVEFRVLTRHQRDGMQDEYDYDPGDPATHRLPLAGSVRVDGVHGGSSICPNATDGRCTEEDLVAAARNPGLTVIVQLVVNGDDQVTEVAEQVGAIL